MGEQPTRTQLREKFSNLTEDQRRQMFGGVDLLKYVDASSWADKETPTQFWLLEDWIPMGRSTLLTGEGGAGKSLMAQQLATCVALGLPFLGLQTRSFPVVYVTCEDDAAELHRRQKAICASVDAPLSDLKERLFLVSRRGEMNNALLHFDANEGATETEFYGDVKYTCQRLAAPILILDNIAHLFDGNENIRHHVAVFCNAMERLATEIGGAVLFLGHPSKSGAQFSGSTAWENQVRTRLFLERPADARDPDLRLLKRAKANYARSGDSLELLWEKGAFIRADQYPDRGMPGVRLTAQASSENARFLSLLDALTEQKRAVSHSPHSQNYAPKMFARMPGAKGMKALQFEQAMERLFEIGEIETGALWKGLDRKPVNGLKRKEGKLRDGSHDLRDSCNEAPGNQPKTLRDGSNVGESAFVRGSYPPPIGGEGNTGPHTEPSGEDDFPPFEWDRP